MVPSAGFEKESGTFYFLAWFYLFPVVACFVACFVLGPVALLTCCKIMAVEIFGLLVFFTTSYALVCTVIAFLYTRLLNCGI